jgi:uncharacterized membrane protein
MTLTQILLFFLFFFFLLNQHLLSGAQNVLLPNITKAFSTTYSHYYPIYINYPILLLVKMSMKKDKKEENTITYSFFRGSPSTN